MCIQAWERMSGCHPVFSFSLPTTNAQLGLSTITLALQFCASKQLHTLSHTYTPHHTHTLPHLSPLSAELHSRIGCLFMTHIKKKKGLAKYCCKHKRKMLELLGEWSGFFWGELTR